MQFFSVSLRAILWKVHFLFFIFPVLAVDQLNSCSCFSLGKTSWHANSGLSNNPRIWLGITYLVEGKKNLLKVYKKKLKNKLNSTLGPMNNIKKCNETYK